METPRLTPDQIGQVSGLVSQYITTQRKKYTPRAVPLSAQQKTTMSAFFSPGLLDGTRLLVLQGERVANPDFYPMLRGLGFNNLPDQSTMAAITFCDVVVSHEPFSNGLLFHELVHLEQYRQLGIPRFSEVYVRGFLNYINLCLGNKFRTMQSARMKNPLCRTGNVSLSVQGDAENSGQVDDGYCHAHSEHLRKSSEHLEKRTQDRHRITEFTDFVSREDSGVVPAMGAILATSTQADAARFLRTTGTGFTRMRNRLRELGRWFEDGEPVPRQREPYKKRVKTGIASNILAA